MECSWKYLLSRWEQLHDTTPDRHMYAGIVLEMVAMLTMSFNFEH